jgi:hypothetical protein
MMKAHNWHTLGWIIWAVVTLGFFVIWEVIGLANREDDKQPLTFFIRKLVGTPNNPVWWVLAAICFWMVYHFNFVRH